METILEAKGICRSYGEKQILKDVSLHLGQGELVSLLGVSGVGKTTLFHVLSGVSRPDSGQVLLGGEDVTGVPGRISYMLQKDLLLPYKKVGVNVAMPLILKGEKKSSAVAKVVPMFERFGIEGTEDMYPGQLSGGMRQRAALLRTYMASDGVALLDEPFSALDNITKSSMHNWFIDIMDKIDFSVLFITHDIDEAVLLSDRIYIISGRPADISREIAVEVPREERADFSLKPEFLEYKRKVVEALAL